MNGFKLIGIRPHKECDKKFLKLLEPGRLYQFYNDYKFFIDEKTQFDGLNGEIHSYEIDQTIPEDLYKIGSEYQRLSYCWEKWNWKKYFN